MYLWWVSLKGHAVHISLHNNIHPIEKGKRIYTLNKGPTVIEEWMLVLPYEINTIYYHNTADGTHVHHAQS